VAIDPLTDARWDDFVAHHPKAGIFHTSAWIDVTQRAFDYFPAHLAYDVDGVLEAVLPLVLVRSVLTGSRLVSLPYSGPAGPAGVSEETVDALVAAATEKTTALRCGYLNLQTGEPLPPRSESLFVGTQPIVCSGIQLRGDASAIWTGSLKDTVRREINKARKSGVSVRLAESVNDLKSFYDLHVKTHHKHGLPPQPYRLFKLMWDTLVPKGMLRLFIALLDGRPIHASIYVGYKSVLSALYAGTDYRFLQFCPVKLLDWVVISSACDEGYRYFDLLQSDVDNPGLRSYKRSFGAVESPVTFYYYPKVAPAYRLKDWLVRDQSRVPRLTRAVVRRIPTAGRKALGAVAFKHMG
jgi:CelD/BcsL family acetyltransferase involved in cellulose biosynthesis